MTSNLYGVLPSTSDCDIKMEESDDLILTARPGPSGDSQKTASNIKAMDKSSVHRLCSGQVILSMAIAVKEIVENALDAGATNIEVKLQEYGSKLIEVNDNGKGVTKENFEALTLKHHTSKISGFEDVSFVSTFGFRGEALSSLCAVSKMSITTRHASSETGTRLDYDHSGAIIFTETCPRPIGTSVKLKDIFCTMPVRLKEFQRNIKKEFHKMIHNLHAYCLIATGIRITCVNTTEKGKRTTILSTGGHDTINSHICEIFGASQNQSLQTIEWSDREPFQEILTDFYLNTRNCSNEFKMYSLSGYISTCEHGKGRSSPDRQFIYINNRPCDMTKVTKLVNEIYHQFNRHQYPFVLLNIKSEKLENVDVNVTPDKRLIFLENEKLLLATIKSCLLERFESTPSTFKIYQSLPLATKLDNRPARENEHQSAKGEENTEKMDPISSKKGVSVAKLRTMFGGNESNLNDMNHTNSRKRFKHESFDNSAKGQTSITDLWKTVTSSKILNQCMGDKKSVVDSLSVPESNSILNSYEELTPAVLGSDSFEKNIINELMTCNPDMAEQTNDLTVKVPNQNVRIMVADNCEYSTNYKNERSETSVNFSFEMIKDYMKRKLKITPNLIDEGSNRFCANIDPKENTTAEEELKKEIKKQDFLDMKIFGQFNRGFIIAGLNNDLFIVDQHASDEKVYKQCYRSMCILALTGNSWLTKRKGAFTYRILLALNFKESALIYLDAHLRVFIFN